MVSHLKEGRRYVYRAKSPKIAKRTALDSLLRTFFEGKPENLVAALLDPRDQQLSKSEIDSIRELIRKK